MPQITWPDGPEHPTLEPGHVHVWSIALDLSTDARAALTRHLSVDERNRARRFVRSEDADRFVIAHGTLRALLSMYVRAAPSDIRFLSGAHGKPSLDGENGPGGLQFSFSHSEEIALCAVARGRAIGVDVEHIRPVPNMEQITRRFFSPRDQAELGTVPAALREHAFYACWTRKEAYIKGVGLGLSLPLDSFDVSVTPGEPARLLARRGERHPARQWRLYDLPIAPRFAAALAVEDQRNAGAHMESDVILSWRLRMPEMPREKVEA